MIGTKLGHYEITSHLGTGGMGEVYQATDSKLGRSVAIKFLPEAFTRDGDRAARFEREARLLASLNHPHIAAIYGIEEINHRKFLVMELAAGETLAQRIQRGPIQIDEARPIARQITEALEAAHEKGIIHRDLKPANIKITPQGDVKVLDFGLAKAFSGDSAEMNLSNSPTLSVAATKAGVILGTAAYMSPEQAKGKEADRTTDIWAFGCVLYEMLSGRPSFEGETLGEILGSVFKSEPDWSRLPAGTSEGIRRLLRRCLQKDRKLRLRDIADARIEIDESFDDAPVVATRSGWITRSRERIVWILMLVILGGIAWSLKPASTSSVPLIARVTIALPPGDQLAINGNTSFALSADGSKVAYVASRAGVQQIYLRALDETEAKSIAGTEDAAGPFFSPNAQWIGFFQQGKLKKVPVNGGATQFLADAPLGRGADWGADDNIYFAPVNTSGIWKVPALGGTAVEVTKVDRSKGELSHRYPQILPGGKAIVFTLWTGPETDARSTYLQILATGERRVLIRGAQSGRYVATGHIVAYRSGSLLAVPFDLSNLTVDSSPPAPLVEVVGSSSEGALFSISGSGSLAYGLGRSATKSSPLVLMDRDGKTQVFSVPVSVIAGVTLSPNGRLAAVESTGIGIYDFARAILIPFVPSTAGASQSPIWSPDSTHIVYRGTRAGFRNLYWKKVDGTGEEERLTTSDSLHTPGSISPKGDWLAYVESNSQTGRDIWILPLVGERKPQVFLNTIASETEPHFSHDGNWIAFRSDKSGRSEIYIRPFLRPGAEVQISTEGGSDPVWSRNGRELYFLNGDKMMAVAMVTQPALSAGSPHMLFRGRFASSATGISDFDVDPDGRFLLIPEQRTEQATTQINIVLNWFEELKKRVPVR